MTELHPSVDVVAFAEMAHRLAALTDRSKPQKGHELVFGVKTVVRRIGTLALLPHECAIEEKLSR